MYSNPNIHKHTQKHKTKTNKHNIKLNSQGPKNASSKKYKHPSNPPRKKMKSKPKQPTPAHPSEGANSSVPWEAEEK